MTSPATAPAAAAPTQDERTMAMLAHVLMLFTFFLGPLIIWLVRRQSRYVSFHALQALAWQVVWVGMFLVLLVGGIVLTVVSAMGAHGEGPPPVFALLIVVAMVVGWAGGILTLILGIVYGIKANNGEWAAYPVVGNWVRQRMGF